MIYEGDKSGILFQSLTKSYYLYCKINHILQEELHNKKVLGLVEKLLLLIKRLFSRIESLDMNLVSGFR